MLHRGKPPENETAKNGIRPTGLTRAGYVYLAKASTGHYKIGWSYEPLNRVRHFDTQMPVEVRVEHIILADDPVKAESCLHRWFDYLGKRVKGEWFNLTDDDVNKVCSIVAYMCGGFMRDGDNIGGYRLIDGESQLSVCPRKINRGAWGL